jgi:superfamily I DNA/RNA helicase
MADRSRELADKLRKLKDEESPDEDRPGIIRSACRLLTRHASAGDALRFVLRCRELSTVAREGSNRPRGKVLLTTAHRFKGQEAERVYLYVEAGTFPHAKAATTEMPDEHRLFYVACTRARDELVLCWKDSPSEYAIRFCKPSLMDGGWVP